MVRKMNREKAREYVVACVWSTSNCHMQNFYGKQTLKSINTIMSIIYLSLQATIHIHSNWVEHLTNKLISLVVQFILTFTIGYCVPNGMDILYENI